MVCTHTNKQFENLSRSSIFKQLIVKIFTCYYRFSHSEDQLDIKCSWKKLGGALYTWRWIFNILFLPWPCICPLGLIPPDIKPKLWFNQITDSWHFCSFTSWVHRLFQVCWASLPSPVGFYVCVCILPSLALHVLGLLSPSCFCFLWIT